MDANTQDEVVISLRFQVTVAELLKQLGAAQTVHDGRRLVDMGAVVVGGVTVKDPFEAIDPRSWIGQEVRIAGRDLACRAALHLIGDLVLA
jgi:hypothetical protein